MTPRKVVVVGAGVVGLSTAVAIQRHLPSTEVTIIADKFLEDTLSIGAGGYFRPEGTTSPGDDVSTMVKWCRDGFDHFSGLLDDPLAGMTLTEGYFLSSVSYENCYSAILDEITHGLVRVPHDELKKKFPEKFQHGYRFSTMMTNMRKYMPYLTKKFTEAGGQVVKTTIDTFSDHLLHDYDVIVNCTGLRAKQLTGDFRMVPIRGQTLKVKAPWVKEFIYADGAYILPLDDGMVTLGGIKEYGGTSMEVSELDRNSIWSRVTALLPSLKEAEVCWEWVGLRPYRQPVRVETEIKDGRTVIHNYGHGGHGVSLSWGTALNVVRLIEELE